MRDVAAQQPEMGLAFNWIEWRERIHVHISVCNRGNGWLLWQKACWSLYFCLMLQKHKCVPLEDLAAEFKLRTQVNLLWLPMLKAAIFGNLLSFLVKYLENLLWTCLLVFDYVSPVKLYHPILCIHLLFWCCLFRHSLTKIYNLYVFAGVHQSY